MESGAAIKGLPMIAVISRTPGRAATARERFLSYFITFACYGARLTIWLAAGDWSPMHNACWQNVEKCSRIPMGSTKVGGQW